MDNIEVLVSRLAGRFLADVQRLADQLNVGRPDVVGTARMVAAELVAQASER